MTENGTTARTISLTANDRHHLAACMGFLRPRPGSTNWGGAAQAARKILDHEGQISVRDARIVLRVLDDGCIIGDRAGHTRARHARQCSIDALVRHIAAAVRD